MTGFKRSGQTANSEKGPFMQPSETKNHAPVSRSYFCVNSEWVVCTLRVSVYRRLGGERFAVGAGAGAIFRLYYGVRAIAALSCLGITPVWD